MKVNVTLDDALVTRIDDYVARNYLSRSGFVSQACVQYLNASDALKAVQDISFALMKIADTGICDEKTLRELEDFERLSKLLLGR